MSTAARKARKRAGIPFAHKPAKVGTPVAERSFVTAPVVRRQGDAVPEGQANVLGIFAPRSAKRIARFIPSGGIKR